MASHIIELCGVSVERHALRAAHVCGDGRSRHTLSSGYDYYMSFVGNDNPETPATYFKAVANQLPATVAGAKQSTATATYL